jgi:hypothetical protein
MNREFPWIFRTREYKGCAIRAASYETEPGSWIPEACFSQYTEGGWRQLWIQSFGHLFGPQGLTFLTQKDADEYAFRIACVLIDKIQPDLQARPQRSRFGFRPPKGLGSHPGFSALRQIFKDFMHRA